MRSRLLKGLLALIAIAVVACGVVVLLARPASHHAFFAEAQQQPLVMAHRGGKGLWPENTLYAFEQAAAMGVDVLEMDIHSTADGVPVVIHDGTVDRTTSGIGPVKAFTLAELKTLDAGYNWSPDDGKTFPYRGQAITVPTLEEVLAAFPTMPMNIEIKRTGSEEQTEPSLAAQLCKMLRDLDRTDQVLVASFHEETMNEFRRECPEVATAATQNEVITLFVTSKALLEAAYSPAAQAVQVPEDRGGLHLLTPRFVDASHHRNLQVHAWTINDVDDMQRLLTLGVDGIITDYPDRLMELLDR
jgi:glycerophosphoryl diester phosphodiesterase